MNTDNSCTAFSDQRIIATGPLPVVAAAARTLLNDRPQAQLLIFDDHTGRLIELDLRGSETDVLTRLADTKVTPATMRGRGRPKLGVVSREVTLMTRHWDWLAEQPGGASANLRRLVEAAQRTVAPEATLKKRRESVYRFMAAMTGNLPQFEDAIRALFADDKAAFDDKIGHWPDDMRGYVQRIAADCFETP